MVQLWALCLLLLAAAPRPAAGQTNVSHAGQDPWAPTASGSAIVSTGSELLAALQAGDGDIALAGEARPPAHPQRCLACFWCCSSAAGALMRGAACSQSPAAHRRSPAARRQHHLAALRLAAAGPAHTGGCARAVDLDPLRCEAACPWPPHAKSACAVPAAAICAPCDLRLMAALMTLRWPLPLPTLSADTPGVVRQLNWGHALGLLNVTSGTTLALDFVASQGALRQLGWRLVSRRRCHCYVAAAVAAAAAAANVGVDAEWRAMC